MTGVKSRGYIKLHYEPCSGVVGAVSFTVSYGDAEAQATILVGRHLDGPNVSISVRVLVMPDDR